MLKRSKPLQLSPLLDYLAENSSQESDRLPPLNEISKSLGISIASLREQLEVARIMGLVEIRPRTGLRRLPYSFLPGLLNNLAYALRVDDDHFLGFSDLRNHIETSYWFQAVTLLTTEDHEHLKGQVKSAKRKLTGNPIQIPQPEHREMHLCIYRRLNNPFVSGILEAYWEMYEAEGLSLYTDLDYLNMVWNYHEQMVDEICSGDFQKGYQALIDHMDLITYRPPSTRAGKFE
jgi:DNA-binding FadR family transcriptional regulator